MNLQEAMAIILDIAKSAIAHTSYNNEKDKEIEAEASNIVEDFIVNQLGED
jgi:hypothetical protein